MRPELDRKATILHRVYSDRVEDIQAGGGVSVVDALSLYRMMLLARRSDEVEGELASRGDAFFHLRCSGHEAMAALAPALTPDDWLHLHYRDKALILARGLPVDAYLHALLCTAESCSRGRQMGPFVHDRDRHVLAQNIPVGNHALQAVGVAAAVRDRAGSPIVLCSMGDGATQQGEVLEAIAEAVRDRLPVLFLVEDNGYAISTPTSQRTFFSLPERDEAPKHYLGLPIHRWDGRDPLTFCRQAATLIQQVRSTRAPALAVLSVERLCNHTNADDERVYRSVAELQAAVDSGDPIRRLAEQLTAQGVSTAELDRIDGEVRAQVERAAEEALNASDPEPTDTARAPLPAKLADPASEYRGTANGQRVTMLEAIREVLRLRLAADPRVSLLGQDIEDPKGDVFGVTRGLTRTFPGRVRNSALSESTIVGAAIGQALAGERPVAFIQFADFLPLAYNQILSELGSMYWRTAGELECPVILMIACGGYRPGLGPFHAQTLESLLARVPGLDVLMPSSAEDAAGLLNAAFISGRPTAFLYPKSCLNDPDLSTSAADLPQQLVPIGRGRRLSQGGDLTLVAWGSTVRIGRQVAESIAGAGRSVDLIDLRSVSPWDTELVCASARRTGRLLVVHEDSRTCGLGAEVVATVVESLGSAVTCRRVTRPDTYIPCNFPNQLDILPSFRRTLAAAADMLELDLTWDAGAVASATATTGSLLTIEALGPSPADQTVKVLTWLVRPGQSVRSGERLAEMEADKAVFELVAPADGRITEVLVPEGVAVRNGAPLLNLEVEARPTRRRRLTREESGHPRLGPRQAAPKRTRRFEPVSLLHVDLSAPTTALGSLSVGNDEILVRFPGRTSNDILKRTGIESRRRLAPGETALGLAVQAARAALETQALRLDQIDALICCTTTPPLVTPSMACLILNELAAGLKPAPQLPAHDVIAACSGYLYALTGAFDMIRCRPDARVLVVSAEALSPQADPDDFDTAILFGDAATATVVSGPESGDSVPFGRLQRPVLSAKGERGKILRVPAPGGEFLSMDGLQVYAEAVRQMIGMLERACADSGVPMQELDMVVPHQANARIIDDIRRRLQLPPERMFVNIRELGNTSSSSIPLGLAALAGQGFTGRVGLTAFGGGYTFGAAVLELP